MRTKALAMKILPYVINYKQPTIQTTTKVSKIFMESKIFGDPAPLSPAPSKKGRLLVAVFINFFYHAPALAPSKKVRLQLSNTRIKQCLLIQYLSEFSFL